LLNVIIMFLDSDNKIMKVAKTTALCLCLTTGVLFSANAQTYSGLGKFYGDQVLHAQVSPNYKNQGKFTLDYYGSGDADGNDTLDVRDYTAMVNGVKNDRTDVNGDEKTDTSDLQLLNKFLTKQIKYLPAHWDLLQTKTERQNWLNKMKKIDKTDEKTYIPNKYDCDGFSIQTFINFAGLEKISGTAVDYNPFRRMGRLAGGGETAYRKTHLHGDIFCPGFSRS